MPRILILWTLIFVFFSVFMNDLHILVLLRRCTHACSFWGYKYLGSSKTLAPDWNKKFLNFIPVLCCQTEENIPLLKRVCELESKGALLFQHPCSKINAVWLFSEFGIPIFCVSYLLEWTAGHCGCFSWGFLVITVCFTNNPSSFAILSDCLLAFISNASLIHDLYDANF